MKYLAALIDWLQHPNYSFIQAVIVGIVPGAVAVYLIWRGLADFRAWQERQRRNRLRNLADDWEKDLDNRCRHLEGQ